MTMTRTKLALAFGLLALPGLLAAAEVQVKTLEIGAQAPEFRLQGGGVHLQSLPHGAVLRGAVEVDGN
jgi:hypothetical protein